MMTGRTCCMLVMAGLSLQAFGQGIDAFMDRMGSQLAWASADGNFRTRLSGTLDLEGYTYDGSPPGLIRNDDETLLQPRLSVFLDAQAGPRWYAFAQARLDQGFDPSNGDLELRLDEYALRFTPWESGVLSLQAGQFATVVGQWVVRHLSWQNGFVTAPLLYENPTRLSDLRPPYSEYSLTYPYRGYGYYYNPIIWGPSYASGFSASGRWRQFDWAVELKNASLSSRPEYWPVTRTGFQHPTVSGRIAWRPDLRWTFGLSASEGSWAGPGERFADPEDYRQQLVLADVTYAHRHLQVWAEYAVSQFSVAGFEDELETRAWFVEVRYKILPRLSAALRWNEQTFSELYEYGKEIGKWGGDLQRLDASVTWRFNAHSQIVLEVDRYWGESEEEDRYVLSSRLTLRF